MTINVSEASAAPGGIEQVVRRVRQSRICRAASDFLILWGRTSRPWRAGYVNAGNTFAGRKPRTLAAASPAGREAFSAHVVFLREITGRH